MWQAPNQRIRAIQSAKKRQQDRLKRPMHIKRVNAEIKLLASHEPSKSISEARVVLNDLSPKGVGMFSTVPMMVGQEVAITLEEPKRVYLRGRIVWCQEFDVDSHVLSVHSFHFRVGMKFTFQSREEEEAVRALCEEISRNHLFTNVA